MVLLHMYWNTQSQKSSFFGQDLNALGQIYSPKSLKCWRMQNMIFFLNFFLSLIAHELLQIIWPCFISIRAELTEIWANRSRGSKFAQNGNLSVRAFGTAISCNRSFVPAAAISPNSWHPSCKNTKSANLEPHPGFGLSFLETSNLNSGAVQVQDRFWT